MSKPTVGIMLRHVRDRGGMQVIASHVVRYLLEHARRYSYHLLYSDESQLEFIPDADVERVVLHAPSNVLWDQWAVPRYARRAGLDVLFNTKFSVPLRCADRTICIIPGADQWEVPSAFTWYDRWYNYRVMPVQLRRASAVITHTEHAKAELVQRTGTDPARIRVVPLAASPRLEPATPDEQARVRGKYGLARRYLLFVGGITPMKNVGNLVRAFELVARDENVELVLAGFRRRKYDDAFRAIESSPVRDRIREVGFVPDADLAALYSAAECYVFPSWYEGFGIPVIEAMACGCPVVTSTGGCLPEVADGAAILVEPGRPQSIATGIRRLLDDPELRREYIERGLRRAAALSWSETGARIAQVIDSVIASRAAAGWPLLGSAVGTHGLWGHP